MKGWSKFSSIVIIVLLACSLCNALQYSESLNDGWNVLNNYSSIFQSTCGSAQLFGGHQVFGQNTIITNLVQLKPHSRIQITFDFWRIGYWAINDNLEVYIDEFHYKRVQNTMVTYTCDIQNNEQIIQIVQIIDHNFNSALIAIQTQLANANGFWGIKNFNIYIEQCPLGCIVCSVGDRLVQQCITWKLAYQTLTAFNQVNLDGWVITNSLSSGQITSCSSKYIFNQDLQLLCGYNLCSYNSHLEKTILLGIHSQVKVHFHYFYLNNWLEYLSSQVNINSSSDWEQIPNYLGQGYRTCGLQDNDFNEHVEITKLHSNQVLQLEFTTDKSVPQNVYFGLRDVKIFINNICDQSYYYECCGDSIKQFDEDCDDGNMIPFDGCYNCQYSCIEGCSLCLLGLCYSCQEPWEYNEQLYLCQLIENVVSENQFDKECDDGNMIPFDGCYNYQYSCGEGCSLCVFGICHACQQEWEYNNLFKICQLIVNIEYENQIRKDIDEGDNIPSDTCSNYFEGCSLCIQGICYACSELWQHDKLSQLCFLVQPEKQILITKKRADVQDTKNCELNCIFCIDRKCYQCLDGYQLDIISNRCESKCGDGIISYDEECENSIPQLIDYECHQCKYTKKCNNKCVFCYEGQCQQCKNGYSLEDNQCISRCGDLLVNRDIYNGKQIEECDNQDGIGCIDCIIQPNYACYGQDNSICETCDELCLECETQNQNLQCKQCIKGYYAKDSYCLKCDINCITCHQTADACTKCYRDDCSYCEDIPGWYTDFPGEKCISECGDGIQIKYLEQCDDGNDEDGDGCSSICEFEYGNEPTYPQFIANLISTTELISKSQYVIIEFSQQVKRNHNQKQYQEFINITFETNTDIPYTISIKEITAANTTLNWVYYQIEILIEAALNYKPQLTIELRETLYNEDDFNLQNLRQVVKLKKPNYISQSQIQTSENLLSLQTKLNYALWAIGLLLFISGNSAALFTALEILQEQSYLRYINVEFPQNIVIYFQSSEQISLDPIMDYFYFQSLPNQIEFDYVEADDKLKQYQINANLFYNMQSLIMNLLAFCLMLLFLYQIRQLLFRINCFGNNYFMTKQLRKVSLAVRQMYNYN